MSTGLHRREAAALRYGLYLSYAVLVGGLAFTVGGFRPWLGWLVALVAVGIPALYVLRWHLTEQEVATARESWSPEGRAEPPPLPGYDG